MNPPSSIRIANVDLKISLSETDLALARLDEGDENLIGCYRSHRSDIVIDPTLVDEMIKEVLFHEIIHAVIDLYGISVDTGATLVDREEQIVNSLAPTMLLTLRSNPEWVEYFMGG